MSDRQLRVTFIGLGAMGLPMARRLAGAGSCDLTVFDVSQKAMQAADGTGRPASSFRDAVAQADVVMTMLPADAHVLSVARELAESGRPGTVMVDLSTIHPRTIREVERLLGGGMSTVSASCMKSVAAAVSGDLTLFVSGPDAVTQGLGPLLAPMATTVIDVGELEHAKSLKLINNLGTATLNLVIAEAIVLGERLGLTRERLVDALEAAEVGGWTLLNHVKRHTLTGDLGPGFFSVRYMTKDVSLAAQMADDYACDPFLCGSSLAALRGATALGHGNHYHPIIIEWLDAISGSRHLTDADANRPTDGALEALVSWVDAAEQLIADHALELGEAVGVERAVTARCLASASATTRAVERHMSNPKRAVDWAHLAVLVEDSRRLAANAEVPGIAIESAHDYVVRCSRRREEANR